MFLKTWCRRSHKGSSTKTVTIRLIILQWAILHKHRKGALKGLKGLSSDALASVHDVHDEKRTCTHLDFYTM